MRSHCENRFLDCVCRPAFRRAPHADVTGAQRPCRAGPGHRVPPQGPGPHCSQLPTLVPNSGDGGALGDMSSPALTEAVTLSSERTWQTQVVWAGVPQARAVTLPPFSGRPECARVCACVCGLLLPLTLTLTLDEGAGFCGCSEAAWPSTRILQCGPDHLLWGQGGHGSPVLGRRL